MLKERIIKMLKQDSDLIDMNRFMTTVSSTYISYDLAGIILKASGHSLQIGHDGFTRLPLSAPEVGKKWIDLEAQIGIATDRSAKVPALARQLWAEEYGDEEARALPFYDRNSNIPGTCWWDDLGMVGASSIIALLQNGVCRGLNCCWAE